MNFFLLFAFAFLFSCSENAPVPVADDPLEDDDEEEDKFQTKRVYFSARTGTTYTVHYYDVEKNEIKQVTHSALGDTQEAYIYGHYKGRVFIGAPSVSANKYTVFIHDMETDEITHVDLDAANDVYMGALRGVDNAVYFSGYTATYGYEWWKYDLETKSASLVYNIRAGAASSGPNEPIVVGKKIYFYATDGTTGYELWVHDTETGTVTRPNDLNSGAGGLAPQAMAYYDGKLYFNGNNGSTDLEVFQWDFSATPSPITTFASGTDVVSGVTLISNFLFFNSNDGTTSTPRAYNLTTSILTALTITGSNDGGYEFTGMGDKVFYQSGTTAAGIELHMFNTTDGTRSLTQDLNSGGGQGFVRILGVVGDKLYFVGTNGTTGYEIHSVDSSGTVVAKTSLNGNGNGVVLADFTSAIIGTKIYFNGEDTAEGKELFYLDTATSTTGAIELGTGSAGYTIRSITKVDYTAE